MISDDVFATVPTLTTERLRLEPLGPEHFEGSWAALQDEESMRLTGTQSTFTEDQIRTWLAGLGDRHDRADWAVIRLEDGTHIGEVVLNDLDGQNESMNLRIALSGDAARGRGYGTEAVRAVLDHGFDTVGLHRISLDVFSFNPAAQRVYEKCGFLVEGRQRHTMNWDGEWVDSILMGILATDPRGV
ncbi:GNAT family N-acetyltransferase [Lysobacter korlensis]|uniref:GNAT family N-acetyltransferase n=1 Tax=Lysobacter korlensis TaxID=553636 RepID=A0ABV6RNS1_9GAMM